LVIKNLLLNVFANCYIQLRIIKTKNDNQRLALSVEATTIAPNAFLFESLQPHTFVYKTQHRRNTT